MSIFMYKNKAENKKYIHFVYKNIHWSAKFESLSLFIPFSLTKVCTGKVKTAFMAVFTRWERGALLYGIWCRMSREKAGSMAEDLKNCSNLLFSYSVTCLKSQ